MRKGRIVETGITDQVLDDPQDPYTQLLVSAVLHLMTQSLLEIVSLQKTFTLHNQGGAQISVF